MAISTSAQLADPGATLAHNMMSVGIVTWIIAALIFFFVYNANDEFTFWATAFGSLSSLGLVIALLGLHALAVRAK